MLNHNVPSQLHVWTDLPEATTPYNQHVLVRVDFNVPIQNGRVLDDRRIRQAAPTIHGLLQKGYRVVLLSHWGRPKNGFEPAYSLKQILPVVQSTLQEQVGWIPHEHSLHIPEILQQTPHYRVYLVENVRFHPGETQGNAHLAQHWAQHAFAYVNEAFSASHRKHTSVYHLAQCFPEERRYIGALFQQELEAGSQIRNAQKLVVIQGGAKIGDKLNLLQTLFHQAKWILVGGAMANTFLYAKGISVGRSFVEHARLAEARQLIHLAGNRLILPIDAIVALPNGQVQALPLQDIPSDGEIIDIGPGTLNRWAQYLEQAREVFWNGPTGKYEDERARTSTQTLARILTLLRAKGVFTMAGGGDTAAALRLVNGEGAMTYISTAGGAMLEFLASGTLPGIQALQAQKLHAEEV